METIRPKSGLRDLSGSGSARVSRVGCGVTPQSAHLPQTFSVEGEQTLAKLTNRLLSRLTIAFLLSHQLSTVSCQLSAVHMKYLTTILFLALCTINASRAGEAQNTVLTTDETLTIPKLSFDPNGELKITASATSSPSDFDFLVGKWKMHNRRLNKRLENCKDWTEFDSWDENAKILSGTADMDTYSTTEMPGQEGNVSKASPCDFSIRKPDCGAYIGWPAMSAFWTRLWSVRLKTTWATSLPKTLSTVNRSS